MWNRNNPIWIYRNTTSVAEVKHLGTSSLWLYIFASFFASWLIRCKKCVIINSVLYINMYTAKSPSKIYKVWLLLTLQTLQESPELHIYSTLSAVMISKLQSHVGQDISFRQGGRKKKKVIIISAPLDA